MTAADRMSELLELLGGTDIYLVDQLMKGRLAPASRILDAGCGGGRNVEAFLRCGYDVWAFDASPRATRQAFGLGRELAADRPSGWVSRQAAEQLGYRSGSFDAVIASALLHFAAGRSHFEAMLEELWRVVKPGGLLFARLASTIGVETRVEALGDGRYLLPGGAEWHLVDRQMLLDWSERLGGRLIEPIKTTVVDDLRSMTTWVMVKEA